MSSQNEDRMNGNTTYHYTGGRPDSSEGEGITHVIVEDGVEFIHDRAFEEWTQLVSIHIPSSVKRIGEYAFHGCTSLLSVDLPASLQHIGDRAFFLCGRLSSINLPVSLNEIGECAFCRCTSLTKISIPPLITSIQQSTFYGCSSLYEVIIPPSVIDIGYWAFRCCCSLKSIKLLNGIQTIEEAAFDGCSLLESIQIPSSIISIRSWAFYECSSLKVVYIPSEALENNCGVFRSCNSSLIILSDVDEYQYQGRPSNTLNNIHQCIQYLSNDPIPPNQQLQALHEVLQHEFPYTEEISRRSLHFGLTLLHLIVYFPGVIYEPLSTILVKCPEAITAVDSNGKTPIHHVMTSTRHNMYPNCYNLLMRHCPDTVVHQAIRAGGLCWDDLQELVEAKIDALTLEDVESGLLPFMLAAIPSSYTDDDVDLSVAYGLLCMNPSVLMDYL